MLLDDARILAIRNGFTLSARGNSAFALIDRQGGLPAVNWARATIEFSLQEAIAYLTASHDRQIGGHHETPEGSI